MNFNLGLEVLDLYKLVQMYHISLVNNYKSILQYGLEVGHSAYYKTGLFKTIYPGIYLSNTKEYSLEEIAQRYESTGFLFITCNILQKNIHLDEDEIFNFIAVDIPFMLFKDTIITKKYDSYITKKVATIKNALILLDTQSKLEVLRSEIVKLFPGFLSEKTMYGQIKIIKYILYFHIWASLRLPSRIDYDILKAVDVVHNGIYYKLPEELIQDMLKILPTSMYSWLSYYRKYMLLLVENSSKHLNQFFELKEYYKNKGNKRYIDMPIPESFVTPYTIDFKTPTSKIIQIDKYKLVNTKAVFEETLYHQ